jgi:hypothetical protein
VSGDSQRRMEEAPCREAYPAAHHGAGSIIRGRCQLRAQDPDVRHGRQARVCRFRARCLRSDRLEGAQAVLGELTLGVLRDLDDQHVAGGPVHDLRWDGAELVIPNGA